MEILNEETMKKLEKEKDHLRVKKKTLQAVLEQCHRALELLGDSDYTVPETSRNDNDDFLSSPSTHRDNDVDKLCDLLKSRVECPDFLEKITTAQSSFPSNFLDCEESGSWDMISDQDLLECHYETLDQEEYVLVRQEDIVEGIASFMAAYLLSLKETKNLTPNQLQEALSRTFSIKKKRGKLRKAWDGSKVLYNVASWSATAIGIYQNPMILQAASRAFWTSCHIISKLL